MSCHRIIDTAFKNFDTGYIKRRLVKFIEDVSVKYDGTISIGNVIQFIYVEDGMTCELIEEQNIETLNINEKLNKNFKFIDDNVTPDKLNKVYESL